MKISLVLVALLYVGTEISSINSLSTRSVSCRKNALMINSIISRSKSIPCELPRRNFAIHSHTDDNRMIGRRDLLQQSSLLAGTAISWKIAPGVAQAASTDVQVVKTDSGLRYIELEEGKIGDTSKTPQYGQLCVISYTGYLQLPNDDKKKKFASQSGFVLKHGNGKLIAGLDEGIHTMKRGGRRRLIIPPKLGFVVDGLGPVPEMPWQRDTLTSLLNEMVAQRGGNLIYDVQLERFFDDEADQGYYGDDEISPEEFAELNRRLNRKNTMDSMGDEIDITERDRQKPIV